LDATDAEAEVLTGRSAGEIRSPAGLRRSASQEKLGD
jgi:hypothetical protein